MKQAFKITATISGKKWGTHTITLTAENEEKAITKAIEILRLKPECEIKAESVNVYATCEQLEVENYPYGFRMKTTARFGIDSNKKGMRTTFQTINPKTGRPNAVKNSTYYTVILPAQNESGSVEYCGYLDFNGAEQFNKGLQFMADFYELFTPEEIQRIATDALYMTKIEAKALVLYCGANFEDIKPILSKPIETLVEISRTGKNLFTEAFINVEALEATKKPDFQPFKVTSYGAGI
jgi:hypothetical protein